MDGYAVAGSSPWRVAGRSLAGEDQAPALNAGEALEIATGAVPPVGSVGVLPYEAATVSDGVVHGRVVDGGNIRRRGEEFTAGTPLVQTGTQLGPAHLGLAATMGLDRIVVHRTAAVSAVITGAEVVASGVPGPTQVRDAIGPMLPGLVSSVGADFVGSRLCGDDPRQLEEWLGRGDDVVLVTGASSAGPSDFLASTLRRLGARCLVASVACRPGRPQSLWEVNGSFVVGLPGNPFAALVAFMTLAAPLV
jgi:molybdopterin molybdotransferase